MRERKKERKRKRESIPSFKRRNMIQNPEKKRIRMT